MSPSERLRAMLALRDWRASENAQARAKCMADASLVAHLQRDAERRGQKAINWVEYFQNLDINYP